MLLSRQEKSTTNQSECKKSTFFNFHTGECTENYLWEMQQFTICNVAYGWTYNMWPPINDATYEGGRTGGHETVTVCDKGKGGGDKKCDIIHFS